MVRFEVISNSTSVGLFLARSRAALGFCHISLWRKRSSPVGVQRETELLFFQKHRQHGEQRRLPWD